MASVTVTKATGTGAKAKPANDILTLTFKRSELEAWGASMATIKTREQAETYLMDKKWVQPGLAVDLDSLGLCLLKVSQTDKIPAATHNALRSAAIILRDYHKSYETGTMMKKEGGMREVVAKLTLATEKLNGIIKTNERAIAEETKGGGRNSEREHGAGRSGGQTRETSGGTTNGQRGNIRERQVLISRAGITETNPLEDFTEVMVLNKARMAIEAMLKDGEIANEVTN